MLKRFLKHMNQHLTAALLSLFLANAAQAIPILTIEAPIGTDTAILEFSGFLTGTPDLTPVDSATFTFMGQIWDLPFDVFGSMVRVDPPNTILFDINEREITNTAGYVLFLDDVQFRDNPGTDSFVIEVKEPGDDFFGFSADINDLSVLFSDNPGPMQVPEPGALSLLIFGLLGIGLARKNKASS